MFHIKFLEKMKTHISCSIIFFPRKLCRLRDNVDTYGTAGEATNDNKGMRITCWVTDKCNQNIAFPRQPWLRERASMLRHTTLLVLFSYMVQ